MHLVTDDCGGEERKELSIQTEVVLWLGKIDGVP
jgi:hypothetical protein